MKADFGCEFGLKVGLKVGFVSKFDYNKSFISKFEFGSNSNGFKLCFVFKITTLCPTNRSQTPSV